jgi:4-hydroxy 2-oxovalerate aldolase
MYLDCTLRDGGYYTNWDFDLDLVEVYLRAMEQLPVDILEVGYRSKPGNDYYGEYFHLPDYRLAWIREMAPSKKIAVMLNEVDTTVEDLKTAIDPIREHIDMVRLAVKPERFDHAVKLAKAIKERGLEVAFNLMYLSSLIGNEDIVEKMKAIDGVVDCFNLVDSYGGVYPDQVGAFAKRLRSEFKSTKLGYHGHNNMELAFANSMAAAENGCEIIDGTITGMGRGAGNLKTELWLTWMATEKGANVDFNALSTVTGEFEAMQKKYEWGTQLAYMVSGASSLPQKDVMDWVTTRSYSLNSIVRALHNQKQGQPDNQQLPLFADKLKGKTALIIGGGPSVGRHIDAIKQFINQQKDHLCLIHASSTNARYFQDIYIPQYYCLVGNEGHRLEKSLELFKRFHGKCILPPYPRRMGTYIPKPIENLAHELDKVSFTDNFKDSHTALALQIAVDLEVGQLWVVGYDGYSGNMSPKEQDLFQENEYLFDRFAKFGKLDLLTPSRYKKVNQSSIYAYLQESIL